MRKVEVLPHNPLWRNEFEEESQQIALVLGDCMIAIHHIGSTAIPNIYAKPILDLLVEVNHTAEVDQRSSGMETLG